MKTLKKPKAKFRVGQPIEFDATQRGGWVPAKIKEVKFQNDQEWTGWVYLVSKGDVWCLESEIREYPPKGLTKAQAKKLKPGTWIRIWWADSEPTVALLIDKIHLSYVPAMYFNRKNGPATDCHANFDQIIEVIGTISPPE